MPKLVRTTLTALSVLVTALVASLAVSAPAQAFTYDLVRPAAEIHFHLTAQEALRTYAYPSVRQQMCYDFANVDEAFLPPSLLNNDQCMNAIGGCTALSLRDGTQAVVVFYWDSTACGNRAWE